MSKKAVPAKSAKPRRIPATVTPGPIGTVLRTNLLTLARELADLNDETLEQVSRRVHSDHRFFPLLSENKCSFTVRKYDEMIEKFRASWPEAATFPTLIDPTHSGSTPSQSPLQKETKHGTRSKKVAR